MMKSDPCDSKDIALKSFFLGPRAENGPWLKNLVSQVFEKWFKWRGERFPEDGSAISAGDMSLSEFQQRRSRFETVLWELMNRFESEIPKFSPRYIGHMFSETSLPAFLGHIVALIHNPNNISSESSRIGVQIEDEAIALLMKMVGLSEKSGTGHFTSGGTLANFEALIRARGRCALWLASGASAKKHLTTDLDLFEAAQMGWERFSTLPELTDAEMSRLNFCEANPWDAAAELKSAFGETFRGPVVLVPEHKHYSWNKGISVLGLGNEALWGIQLDSNGKLSIDHLVQLINQAKVENRPILMVVSVLATTELGAIDPVDQVQEVLDEFADQGIHIWHHVDAAYGGFFCSLDLPKNPLLDSAACKNLAAIRRANSITLDPHKLGYVPYSSGAFLVRLRQDYFGKAFGAPYVQFNPTLDKGLFTLEGSRSAAGAAATWMTGRSIGFDSDGYGRILSRTIQIKRDLEVGLLSIDKRIRIAPSTDTNILCFTLANQGEKISVSNRAAEIIWDSFSPQGNGPFYVSKTQLSWKSYRKYLDGFVSQWGAEIDHNDLVLIRLCTMNPFFGSVEMDINFQELFLDSLSEQIFNLEASK